jgi:GNAT superfamily N-acetyltransferase
MRGLDAERRRGVGRILVEHILAFARAHAYRTQYVGGRRRQVALGSRSRGPPPHGEQVERLIRVVVSTSPIPRPFIPPPASQ